MISIQILIAQVKDLNECCAKIARTYILYFPRNKPSKSVAVGSGRSIALKYSASPKIVIGFRFFLVDVLERFESRRGVPYTTANRNLVHFAHSRNKP